MWDDGDQHEMRMAMADGCVKADGSVWLQDKGYIGPLDDNGCFDAFLGISFSPSELRRIANLTGSIENK